MPWPRLADSQLSAGRREMTLSARLAKTARGYLREPVHKTIRMLLAYNVDIVIKLPTAKESTKLAAAGTDAAAGEGGIEFMPDLFGKGLPFSAQGNELHARLDANNDYPVLLAVLTQKM